MPKKKGRTSRVSHGGREKANKRHEEKRQAYFAKKKEEGRAYKYTPNPFDSEKQPEEWATENYIRQQKTVSHKLPLARLTSFFAKLDNQMELIEKKRKEDLEAAKAGRGKRVKINPVDEASIQ